MIGKLLFIDEIHPVLAERMAKLGFECHFELAAPKENIMEMLWQYTGLVCKSRFRIDREFLEYSRNLRFIARAGIGTEHIDTEFAATREITVFTSPEGSSTAVGEHTLGLLLSMMNHLTRADRQIREGKWIRKENTGTEVKGKTIGILGYGNLGKSFARKVRCLEPARIIAHDKYKKNFGDEVVEEVSLEELFHETDIFSIHIYYDPHNHYCINEKFIGNFRKNIWLINTSRGLVLNTEDLVTQLRKGKVLGAALDVLEYEETSFEKMNFEALPEAFHYLVQSDKVILSPHIAGWSEESYEGHARALADKIEKMFLNGR